MEKEKERFSVFWNRILNMDSEGFLNILGNLPKKQLFACLQASRGRGRNDYAIPRMWESIYRRFLFSENDESKVSSSAASRFLTMMKKNEKLIDETVEDQIRTFFSSLNLKRLFFLMGFIEEKKSNIRYHYILDGIYGIPLVLHIENVDTSVLSAAYQLLEELDYIFHDFNLEKILIADDYYDSACIAEVLWDKYQIKPIIPLKKSREMIYTDLSSSKNTTISSKGDVFCVSPVTKNKQKMVYCGFEKSRRTLKFKCAASFYDVSCKDENCCRAFSGVRIPMEFDRRLFPPIPHCSYKFQTFYEKNKKAQFFSSYLQQFSKKLRKYDREKKKLLCMLLQSFLLGAARI